MYSEFTLLVCWYLRLLGTNSYKGEVANNVVSIKSCKERHRHDAVELSVSRTTDFRKKKGTVYLD
jgi:hypothetical protein